MPNLYLTDDSNFRYKIGATNEGINALPLYNNFKIYDCNMFPEAGTSVNVSSHGNVDIIRELNPQYTTNGYYYPIAIIGIDASLAYYCNIQKFYLTYTSSNGHATINIRVSNAGSSTYTINRMYVAVLYVLRTNNYFLTSIYDDIYGGVM